MAVNIIDPTGDPALVGEPIEIAPGRGNLRQASVPASEWFNGTSGRGGLELIGGKVVSHACLAAEQPWVGAAIAWLLRQAIRVPLKTYRAVDAGDRQRVRPREHPLARSIVNPWEGAGQAQLVQSLLGALLVHGNGVDGVEEGASGRIRFDDFDWRTLTPIKASRRRIAGWTIREDGEEREIGADQAIHVAWWSPLGPVGVSPLRQLGTTVRIEQAAQRHQTSMLRQGARPPSAITATPEFLGLDPAERQALLTQLRGDVDAIYAGPENAGRPALLPPGLDWKPVGHSAHEAQLVQQREVARSEVIGVYGLTPGVLGLLKDGGESLADQRQMAITDGLAPPLILIEAALNAQLVREQLREDDLYVEFDFAGILRGDRLKEVQALREAIASALLTPNEGRRLLNEPKSDQDGMDDFYLPRNNLWPLRVPYPDQPPAAPAQED